MVAPTADATGSLQEEASLVFMTPAHAILSHLLCFKLGVLL